MAFPDRGPSVLKFNTHLRALDGIRGLAVLIVFLTHYLGNLGEGSVGHVIKRMRDMGWVGVDLFFVLSGFLITGILVDTRNDSHYFKRFFARRALRILPVFYLIVAVVLVSTPIFHYHLRWAQLSFLVYLGNFFMIQDGTLFLIRSALSPLFNVSFAHFWSLCVEEQFYLIWPLFVWFIPDRRRLLQTAIVISAVTLIVRSYVMYVYPGPIAQLWTFHTLPFRLDTMLMGGILALLLRGPLAERWQHACRWLLLADCVALALMLSLPQYWRALMTQTIGLTLVAIACATLIGSSLHVGSSSYLLLSNKALRYLGKYSYSFYLFHILYSTAWSGLRIYLARRLHSKDAAILIVAASSFVVTLLVAKLSYDFFEVRFLRLKTRFEYDSETMTHHHAFITD